MLIDNIVMYIHVTYKNMYIHVFTISRVTCRQTVKYRFRYIDVVYISIARGVSCVKRLGGTLSSMALVSWRAVRNMVFAAG